MWLKAEGIGFGGVKVVFEGLWDLQPLAVNPQPNNISGPSELNDYSRELVEVWPRFLLSGEVLRASMDQVGLSFSNSGLIRASNSSA